MNIVLKEKFRLIEKLEQLKESVSGNEDLVSSIDMSLHSLKKGVTATNVTNLVERLSVYSWNDNVQGFLTSYETFINENKYSLRLENILESLVKSNYSNTYNKAIELIKDLLESNNEISLKSNFYKLDEVKFIAPVRQLLAIFESTEFKTQETKEAVVSKSVVSPVKLLEESFVFNLNGTNFEVANDFSSIKHYGEVKDSKYNYLLSALSTFTFESSTGSWLLNTDKAAIRIKGGDNVIAKINENEFTSLDQFRTGIKSTNAISHFDYKLKSLVEFMFENVNLLVDIDLVKQVKCKDSHFNYSFIKLSENRLVLNVVNKFEAKNELVQVNESNLESIKADFKVKLGLNIDSILESINVSTSAIELDNLISKLDINSLVENTDLFLTSLSMVNEFKSSLSKDDITKSKNYSILEQINLKVNEEVIKALIEAKTKVSKEDFVGKEEVINYINSEIKNELK